MMQQSLNNAQNENRNDKNQDIKPVQQRRAGGFYDRSHPGADWSGYVPDPKGRKTFYCDHKNIGDKEIFHPLAMCDQLVTAATGDYFGPCSYAATNEWKHSGRKNAPFKKDAIGIETITATQWETEAQSAMNKRHTVIDQLTDFGRAIHIRGRKPVTPPFERKQVYDPQLACQRREENPYNLNGNNKRTVAPGNVPGADVIGYNESSSESNDDLDMQKQMPYGLVGFRSSLEIGSGEKAASLIGDMGTRLLDHLNSGRFCLPGAQQVDPYRVANGQRRKDLLLENYSDKTPGYTGNKRRNLYI